MFGLTLCPFCRRPMAEGGASSWKGWWQDEEGEWWLTEDGGWTWATTSGITWRWRDGWDANAELLDDNAATVGFTLAWLALSVFL